MTDRTDPATPQRLTARGVLGLIVVVAVAVIAWTNAVNRPRGDKTKTVVFRAFVAPGGYSPRVPLSKAPSDDLLGRLVFETDAGVAKLQESHQVAPPYGFGWIEQYTPVRLPRFVRSGGYGTVEFTLPQEDYVRLRKAASENVGEVLVVTAGGLVAGERRVNDSAGIPVSTTFTNSDESVSRDAFRRLHPAEGAKPPSE